MEAGGEASDDEKDFGIYQKDRLDNAHDSRDTWTADYQMNFDLEGISPVDDEDIDPSDAVRMEGDEVEGGGKITWEDEVGPQGRIKYDEYYDARKAKNKKQEEMLRSKG